ncbi:TPA: inverse autotransporter beta domain-containing protein [Escherichia coli]|nr:inverse autotransporter beta domain-containing protein [Escherichia coli]
MAGKAHGNGERRGDNTICGLGDRLRRLTAGICLITQTIFPVMAAAPTHINHAHSDTATSLILPNVKTIPYTLGALETPPTVAARFGITVDELRRLNQFRTFARGFDNVRQGDEIDVPLINSNSPEARNLKAMQMERDGKDPQMQVAEVAQQSGTLLARDMDSEQAASMARGWVASSASAQATDWLSRWGTARVSLGVDEDFSLKSSSFEFLHPWYETPDNLVFSQHTLHRTDDRTQTNHGIGWRYFTPSWMSGVNMFIDHDLTRYHTRTGIGVEYWRDYLKLSGNGYLRLSNWRSAPELDHDYEARPANGWDLRAEGWLPAWPQLGGKLVYEQYYGDEVALFGKDERQNDPHAITAGLSYTPVPLISFSAEQRQGKQGENDTRIGMELTLQPGHSLQKQLDPAEVAARRSLVGSRYDLVDRNNNIVLEYRKKELVRLTLTDPLKGKPGEVKSLVSSLQTKYALKGYDIEAASLQSAGGKVAVSGKDIQVTIPPYRFTAMPETDNTYPIAVTAEDSKGNFSRREESMVVVEKPTLSLADSTLSVDLQILLADGKSTSTLTYTARDSSGKPIPGMTLKTQAKGLQDFALSEWKDNGNGTYTQIVTAGKTSGALSLMPQFNGDDIAKTPALIAIVANTASRADSTIETDQDNYVAGKPIVVKVTLRDDNGNGVTGRKELLKQTVKVDNTKADAVSAWTEESEGIYKASYTAHLIGDKLTAQLTMPGWQTKHSDAFSIAGDKDTAKIAAMQITATTINNSTLSQNVTFIADVRTAKIAELVVIKDGSVADASTANTLQVKVTDANGNTLAGQTVSVMAGNGATVAPTVITEPDGTVEISVTSQTAGVSAVTASINSSSLSRDVTFIADVRTAQIAELVVIKDNSVADGATANTLQVKVTDAFGNTLAGQTVSVTAGNGATVAPTVITEPDGTVEISITSQTAGISTVTATINNSTLSQNVTFVADVRTAKIADLVVIKDDSVADGAMANILRARVTDAFGNTLAGQTVSVMADNGATVASTMTTKPDGTVEISVTSQTAGISTVTATINNSTLSQNVTFIADVRTAKIADLVVIKDGSEADGSTANTLRARVTDAFGNALNGQTVSVTAGNGATVTPTVTTQPDGTVEISVTSQTAGTTAVTANINSSSQSRNVTFIADVRTAKIADLVVTRDNSVADGAMANTLQVKVTDAFGNALNGQTVSVSADNSAMVTPTVTTQPDGTVEISVTSQTAGISTVTASINSSSQSRDVTFIADVRTAQIASLEVTQDNAVADGAMADMLRARVTDAFGNALGGQTVSVTAGNSATVTPTVTTQSDGTVEFSVTSQTAGVSAVTATINNHSLSQNVTFVPGDASQLTSTVETNKSNYTVGETITITVTLRDAFDNLVTGAASQLAANSVLTVDGTDPSETGSWVESGGVYTTTRMATIAGTDQHANLQLQTWSDGVTSDRYDIQSGSPAQATSTIATDKNAYTAGETITVAVTLKDAHGNLVEGGESLLSGDNVTVEGAVRSGEWSETAGVYTATWSAQMAGDSHHATLTLPEWGNSKQSESYSIHSGAPVQANSAIRTDKSAYIAGEPLTVTVTLRDEFGNPALGLTSEVIESYIDNFAVGGATPDSLYWVEQNSGEYTIVWTAWVAEENLVASLKLKTWAMEIKSSLYGIQPGAAAQTQSTIVTDKTKYIAGDSITVTVVLKDAQGNFITDGVAQLNEENVQVRNADSIQGNNWVYNGDGKYQRQYMAHFAEANLNAQLKMAGWSDANYSKNYTINRGEVSMFRSQLRIREVLVVAGADIPVSVLLSDEFGNPVNDGLELLTEDAVYLQNVEKKEGAKWVSVGEGRYERTYRAYKEGENLNSYLHINGWYVDGQPSYTILPFVEVESLSVNGVRFRATDGFPETGFDGAKFTLLLTHNMRNTDYNWTAGIYGINVDSNGEVTLSLLIRSEVTITGKPKNGKGNDVVYKFKIKKWFTSLGAASSNTWDIINASCSYGQMPSSLELAQRPSGGVVPRKVGTLWGEYGNLKTYGNAFSGTDYWTTTQLLGVHEKFNPETGISELGTGKSSGLCVEYY